MFIRSKARLRRPQKNARHALDSSGAENVENVSWPVSDVPSTSDALMESRLGHNFSQVRVHADEHQQQEGEAPPLVTEALRSGGQPLDDESRALMESRLGHNFGQVRVHADEDAARSAAAVQSLAYTVGSDIVFGSGQYAPNTSDGQRLIAHELTHVVQQRDMTTGGPLTVGPVDDAYEREAEATAQYISDGGSVLGQSSMMGAQAVQREATRLQRTPSLNPYAGTDLESAWQQGYDDGLARPGVDLPPPPGPYSLDSERAYLQGVAAANGRTSINPEGTEGSGLGELAMKGVEYGHKAYDVVEVATELVEGGMKVAVFSLGKGLLIGLLLTIVTPDEPPPDPSDPDLIGGELARICRERNCSQLFMPLCQRPGHQESGDAVFNAGYWHGGVHFDYWEAYSELMAHWTQRPADYEQGGILHYVVNNGSGTVEVIIGEHGDILPLP